MMSLESIGHKMDGRHVGLDVRDVQWFAMMMFMKPHSDVLSAAILPNMATVYLKLFMLRYAPAITDTLRMLWACTLNGV